MFAQKSKNEKKDSEQEKYPPINVDITSHLSVFKDTTSNAEFRITLCGDVPNNKKPYKVAYQQESGHVFLILQKIIPADTINCVFGFYPKRGLPTLFFKSISSRIKDNSAREYDVEISMSVNQTQFDTILSRSISLADKKYHINKYNCYDYALLIFNSVIKDDTLPNVAVRFPFIFGKGGSPVSVYKDLKRLQNAGSAWAPHIRFGEMRAPVSSSRAVGSGQ